MPICHVLPRLKSFISRVYILESTRQEIYVFTREEEIGEIRPRDIAGLWTGIARRLTYKNLSKSSFRAMRSTNYVAQTLGSCGIFYVSAASGECVDSVFNQAAESAYEFIKKVLDADKTTSNSVSVSGDSTTQGRGCGC